MPKLSIVLEGTALGEAELKSGVNYVGRSPENDVSIQHHSISGRHCEIHIKESSIFVRDLGSTNGTFIDGEPIYERELLPGQTLMAGNVELTVQSGVIDAVPAPALEGTRRSGLRVAKVEPTAAPSSPFPPRPVTPAPVRAYPFPKTSNLREKGFYGLLPDAFFHYPFRKDGWIAMICGTVVFLVLNFIGAFSILVAVIAFGYLAAFMQKMIVSSGQGEEDLPQWPEFADWYSDIIHPALLLLGSFAVSFGPAVAVFIWSDFDPGLKLMVGLSLVVFGCFYLPMALIATSMYGSMAALNPLLIVPSMVRIAKEYIVVCLLLGFMVGLRVGIELLLELVVPWPVVPAVISGFFDLYFVIVEMRILGLLYFFKEDELSWSF